MFIVFPFVDVEEFDILNVPVASAYIMLSFIYVIRLFAVVSSVPKFLICFSNSS